MMHHEIFSSLPLLTGSFKVVGMGRKPASLPVMILVESLPGKKREVPGLDDGGMEQVSFPDVCFHQIKSWLIGLI